MKKLLILTVLTAAVLPFKAMAQDEENLLPAQYGYQVKVENQHDRQVVERLNQMLSNQKVDYRRGGKELGAAIREGYSNLLLQKTLNASSNLISLSVSYLSEVAHKKTRGYRLKEWMDLVEEQNTKTTTLSSETRINDFYYLPSTAGPFDADNLKFSGITCYNYIETSESRSERETAGGQGMGHDVFYIHCSLRTDSLGLADMAYHSKFKLQLDTLAFYPDYCGVPMNGEARHKGSFDFDKRGNLSLRMNIKVYSSWINQAVEVFNDVQIGEFTVYANIRPDALTEVDGEKVFLYGRSSTPATQSLVSLSGSSFIVPRSYIGGVGQSTYGTGEYRLEISVTESCSINTSYYMVKEVGKGQAVGYAALPGVRKWDKEKWKPEWRALKGRDRSHSFFHNAWDQIKEAYIGGDWVQEVCSPVATAIYAEEAKYLREVIDF